MSQQGQVTASEGRQALRQIRLALDLTDNVWRHADRAGYARVACHLDEAAKWLVAARTRLLASGVSEG